MIFTTYISIHCSATRAWKGYEGLKLYVYVTRRPWDLVSLFYWDGTKWSQNIRLTFLVTRLSKSHFPKMSLSQFSLVCFIKEMCPYLQNIDSYNQLPHLASFQISSHSDQITADVACQIYSHSLFTSLQSWVYLPVISSEPIFFLCSQ